MLLFNLKSCFKSCVALSVVSLALGMGTVSAGPNTPGQVKTFEFTWVHTDTTGVSYYRLTENPDRISGFSEVAIIPLESTSYDLEVPLHLRADARYILSACTEADLCSDSNLVDISHKVPGAIGYFKASNTAAGDSFGGATSLSADGNVLVVGARQADVTDSEVDGDVALASAGAVYVFEKSDGIWAETAYITASNAGAGDRFGNAVSLNADGSILAVGAFQEDSSAGAVYLFEKQDDSWVQRAYIKADNAAADSQFGQAVSLNADGTILAVGANLESAGAGAVYVFEQGASNWAQASYIQADEADAADSFGSTVSLSRDGDVLAVGASSEDGGAVYVFEQHFGSWDQSANIKPDNSTADDLFGSAISLSADGNVLAVGAGGEDGVASDVEGDNSISNSGAAYLFTRNEDSWDQSAYIKASNADVGDAFGTAVSLNADGSILAVSAAFEGSDATAINGAQDSDAASTAGAGAAYVFKKRDADWNQIAYIKASNTDADDAFGAAVSLSADGNVLAVGATGEAGKTTGVDGDQGDNSAAGAGAVYLY